MPPLAWLTTERDWPWRDEDLLGWPGLLAVAAVLVLLTLWTYSGQRRIGWGKLLTVLGLRLGALAVTALLLLRPSFASEQSVVTSGKLILVLDCSLSMKITDGPKSSSRWDAVRQLLEWPEVKDALQRLQTERQIEVIVYQGAEDLRKYDPASDADGKRTDIGQWLHTLMTKHRSDPNLRGILIFTDGADNGTRYLAVEEAAQFRGLSCPVHTFGAGLETTRKGQNDIAVVDVKADPERVYVKNKVKVKATIDAPGMADQVVTVRLLVDGKQVSMKDGVKLPNERGNVVEVGEVIPETVGEMKVTVKVDEVPGEYNALNNEMSTYVTVDKKGITVLWVESRERLEATWVIREVLSKDPRFNVTYDQRPAGRPLSKEQAEFFTTPEKMIDVVVIGNVDAAQFCGGDANVLRLLASQVASRRTGLLMLGSAKTFDWRQKNAEPVTALLPVELNEPGQIDDQITVVPDNANKGHRLLQIGEPGKDVWNDAFKKLAGMTKLGKPRPAADVLALARVGDEQGEPILVVTKEEGPRAAAFGGENTYQAWYGNDDAVKAYKRFWSQLFVWLARQEQGDNYLSIELDKRRMAAGARQKLGFTVRMLGKDGGAVSNPDFTITVHGPGGEKYDVAKPRLRGGEYRGEFDQANAIGEYRIEVTGTGTGKEGKFSAGPVSARFTAFSEDVENQRPGADHKFLTQLATAGGGTFRLAGREELLQYLGELRERTAAAGWVKREVWPNWKYTPASDGLPDQIVALVASGMLPCLVGFVGLVGAEWFLRRWWGLV